MSKKSILEQALLQVETLEEVMKANAKNILSSTMKKEIKEMLKEQEEDEDEDEKEVEEPETQELEDPDMGDDKTSSDDTEMEADEPSDDMDATDNLPSFMDNDETEDDDDETLDLTNASDEEVIKVYKSLKPEDGVIVKKSGDDIKMKTDDEEYLIRLNDEDDMSDDMSDEMSDEMDEDWDYDSPDGNVDDDSIDYDKDFDEYEDEDHEDEEHDSHEDEDEDEDESEEELDESDDEIYEIELDDEEDETSSSEEEVEESARTKGFGYHGGIENKKMFKAGNKREEMNEQITKLKEQNAEYRKALVLFKEKLDEVAVFNANLAYANKLISENTTTKQEKIEILKRFDNVENLNESKNLYVTIKNELKSKKPVVESVVNKISNSPTTSTSKEVLTESKAYENPAFKRIKDLMNKIS